MDDPRIVAFQNLLDEMEAESENLLRQHKIDQVFELEHWIIRVRRALELPDEATRKTIHPQGPPED